METKIQVDLDMKQLLIAILMQFEKMNQTLRMIDANLTGLNAGRRY